MKIVTALRKVLEIPLTSEPYWAVMDVEKLAPVIRKKKSEKEDE